MRKQRGLKTSWEEQIFRDDLQARTGPVILAATINAYLIDEARVSAAQPVPMAERLAQISDCRTTATNLEMQK